MLCLVLRAGLLFGLAACAPTPMRWERPGATDTAKDEAECRAHAHEEAIRRLPYVVRASAAGLEQSPVTLEEAAANLGAPPATVLRRVTVPLIAANLAAGALLAFSFAMLEVSDSLILARKVTDYPITKAIWDLYNRLGEGQFIASALGVWAMALLVVTIVATSRLLGRRLGAVFRL